MAIPYQKGIDIGVKQKYIFPDLLKKLGGGMQTDVEKIRKNYLYPASTGVNKEC